MVGHHHVAGGGFGRPARVDAVEYDGYPDAEPLLSLEEETWRQVPLVVVRWDLRVSPNSVLRRSVESNLRTRRSKGVSYPYGYADSISARMRLRSVE